MKQILKKFLDEKRAKSEDVFMVHEPLFANSYVSFNSVLLDGESSRSIFSNAKLFVPGTVTKLDEHVEIKGAGGGLTVEYEGETKLFGKVLYSPHIPCQILCFYDVSELYEIEYIHKQQIFRVYLPDCSYMDFKAYPHNRMYIYELDADFVSQLDSRDVDPIIRDIYHQSLLHLDHVDEEY